MDFLVEKIRVKVESDDMTPMQRFTCLITGETPDRIPVFVPLYTEWAAHYIGYKLNKDFAFDAKKWVHATLIAVERIGVEIAGPFYDMYNIGPDAMGAEVLFPEDALPEIRTPAINSPDDLANLKIPDPKKDGRMPQALEALKLTAEKIGDLVPVFPGINAPFSWAANMRGVYNYIADLKRNPKFAKDLLDFVTDAVIEYLKAELELGLGPVLLADAAATEYLLSPKQIEEYVFWSYKKVQEALGQQSFLPFLFLPETQAKLIKEGIGLPFLGVSNYAYCDRTGTDPLKEEDILSQKKLAKELGVLNMVALWGQWMQVHSPREIDQEIKRVTKLTGPDWPFMVGAMHIPLGTPVENVDALVRAIKKYGKFPIQL